MQRAGRSCLVLERTDEFPDRTKGEWIAPWGVAEAMRLGVVDVLASARGHVIRRHVSFDPALDPDDVLATPTELALLPGVDGPMTQRHPDACQVLFDAAARGGRRHPPRRRRTSRSRSTAAGPTVTWTDGAAATERSARLVVGADGRNSQVRRALGFELAADPPHHLFSGLLVDGADDYPAELQAIGTEGDVHFLVFPQGDGRARLYLGFGLDQPRRFTGPGGPQAFVDAFRFACMPARRPSPTRRRSARVRRTPTRTRGSTCPSATASSSSATRPGGTTRSPGRGCRSRMRDVRVVSEILQASDDWSAAAFAPYVEERRERMRRLRFGASLQAAIYNEFGPEAAARRLRAWSRFEAEPELVAAHRRQPDRPRAGAAGGVHRRRPAGRVLAD